MSSFAGPVLALLFALVAAGYVLQNRLPPPTPKIIGIDLGTTFSCVGTYESKSGNVTVYKDENDKPIMPSVVAILNNTVLVGYKAVEQIEVNSRNTIYDAKRFIGKTFTDVEMMKYTNNYPFKLTTDDDGHPKFKVCPDVEEIQLSPEEIGAHILRRLKKMVEIQLDRNIHMAVISVPADFDQAQRNATIRAGRMAGLRILRVINEPTAAALAYGLHKKPGTNQVLVIDFGGGTLDVSLLMVHGGMFVTMAMAGNNRLGGQDVNNVLINYFRGMLERKFQTSIENSNDLQIIRDNVERVKLELTDRFESTFHVSLSTRSNAETDSEAEQYAPIAFSYVITRNELNKLCRHLFRRFMKPIRRVLADAEISKDEVDEIVLVGGSTRLPRVREMVHQFFGKVPNTSIDADIAVVTGVAVQANILGNGWPLKVSAVEIHNKLVKKVNVEDEEDEEDPEQDDEHVQL